MNRINHISGWNRASAALGSVVWLSFGVLSAFGVLPLELIEHLFLLTPLVIVPLGLGLLNSPDCSSRWLAAGSFLQPFAATLALTSFFLPEGKLAAVMASGWLVATVLLGLSGLGFPRKLFRNTTEACFDAALLYLPVGAIWLVLSRLGATPMHLAEPIVLLTAVHFHFSGFGLAVIAGATGRALRAGSTASKIFRFVAIGLIGGTFLIAIGFLTSPLVKVAAIALFAGNLSLLSMFLLTNLSTIRGGLARVLLGVAASSLAVGMALALLYGVGEYMGELLVSIPRMAKLHGPLNSIGFTLCALVGWALEEQRRASRLALDLLGWLGDKRHWPKASFWGRAPKQPLVVVEHHDGISMQITSQDT